MKSPDGREAEHIEFGSTLSGDKHTEYRFEYLIANPPYGKDWKRDEEAVRDENSRGTVGRFPAGVPKISDGQMLFLEHMVSKMNPPEDGGARVAIVMNGSPLFTGDAGSGESEVRRWIFENDWLEAIVALPEQLFYNTGIATYVWVLTNRKAPSARAASSSSMPRRSGHPAPRPTTIAASGTSAGMFPLHGSMRCSGSMVRSRRPSTRRCSTRGLRLPEGHDRSPTTTELPGQFRADRAARGGEGIRRTSC